MSFNLVVSDLQSFSDESQNSIGTPLILPYYLPATFTHFLPKKYDVRSRRKILQERPLLGLLLPRIQ